MLASSRAERSDWIRHCKERSDETTGCFLHSLSLGEGAGERPELEGEVEGAAE
jgi:hypothetical protein